MKLFAGLASLLGALVAMTATAGSWHGMLDEPEMPESLL